MYKHLMYFNHLSSFWQRTPQNSSQRRAVYTTLECSITESCWTPYRWMPTPMAAFSTLKSLWTPTFLPMPPPASVVGFLQINAMILTGIKQEK